MKKKDTPVKDKKIIEKTLDRLAPRKQTPKGVFVALLLLYLAASFIVSTTANLNKDVMLFGMPLPIYAFAGVFSSLSNIAVIFMAVYCGKKGYFTAIALLTIQMPVILVGVLTRGNLSSLPGIFGNILAIVAITVVFLNNRRVQRSEDEMRRQAVTDMMTELPNMYACTKLLLDLMKHRTPFANVTININGFKNLNDTMGFDAGNKVLIDVGTRWKDLAESGKTGTQDFIGHLSGDEFVLIIRGYKSDEDIINTIKYYETALSSRLTVDGCDFYITASFGYAEYPKDADTVDTICSYSSTAMHEIKRANSSMHIMRFSPDMLKREQTLETEKIIRDALSSDTVYFHLQPQFDMSHRLRGLEALARMKDDKGNNISPAEFIPVAEKVGLVDKIDGAVFRKSAVFFGRMLEKYGADIILSINVSVRHLMKNDFLDEVREVLRVSRIPPDKLEIEITESIMIDSVDKALQCINELGEMGVKLAIDDFGTGYSSLSYLHKFPADLLKIDKSFIDKMNTSESSREYVAAIISIGHIMGFEVISEGVEEEAQLATLREIGCDLVQGFIWGRPLSEEDAEKLIAGSV